MRTQLAHLRRVLPRHVAEGGRNLRGRRLQPDAHVGWTSTRHPSHEPEPRGARSHGRRQTRQEFREPAWRRSWRSPWSSSRF